MHMALVHGSEGPQCVTVRGLVTGMSYRVTPPSPGPYPPGLGKLPGWGRGTPSNRKAFSRDHGFQPCFSLCPHLPSDHWPLEGHPRAGRPGHRDKQALRPVVSGTPPLHPPPPKSSLAFRKGKAFPTPASQAVEEAWQVCKATCDPGGAWRDREGQGPRKQDRGGEARGGRGQARAAWSPQGQPPGTGGATDPDAPPPGRGGVSPPTPEASPTQEAEVICAGPWPGPKMTARTVLRPHAGQKPIQPGGGPCV